MTAKHKPPRRRSRGQPRLIFAPLAWLKLQFFCHVGDTEIGGFGITAKNELLYVEEFITVRQRTSSVTVAMEDEAVADFTDRCVDAGLSPQRFLRVWCHTHPGSSPLPSGTDEDTFDRVFGSCDWAVMFILSRSSNTFCRLSLNVGPGSAVEIPVAVDWSAWPAILGDPNFAMAKLVADWHQEFTANINRIPDSFRAVSPPAVDPLAVSSPWEPFADAWDWTDLNQELLEEYERHERSLNHDPRT
jgi:proteasome lid subunit RPN8/RPN11